MQCKCNAVLTQADASYIHILYTLHTVENEPNVSEDEEALQPYGAT